MPIWLQPHCAKRRRDRLPHALLPSSDWPTVAPLPDSRMTPVTGVIPTGHDATRPSEAESPTCSRCRWPYLLDPCPSPPGQRAAARRTRHFAGDSMERPAHLGRDCRDDRQPVAAAAMGMNPPRALGGSWRPDRASPPRWRRDSSAVPCAIVARSCGWLISIWPRRSRLNGDRAVARQRSSACADRHRARHDHRRPALDGLVEVTTLRRDVSTGWPPRRGRLYR
ncbi:unnamed protein product [Acanthosepion pharaonis]|uniref:Uncharacterized protein n=1 Tax=Acanthosepion pharaonis TaxID=158019 RepID=A0A812DIP8_ACAPH|nr:unnamed protein product [Sepia pharaonis]